MTVHGFKSRPVAERLRDFAERLQADPQHRHSDRLPQAIIPGLRAYYVLPIQDIAAAQLTSSGWMLGVGDAYLLERNPETGELDFCRTNDSADDLVIETVVNICDVVLPGINAAPTSGDPDVDDWTKTCLAIQESSNGDLVVVRPCPDEGSEGSGAAPIGVWYGAGTSTNITNTIETVLPITQGITSSPAIVSISANIMKVLDPAGYLMISVDAKLLAANHNAVNPIGFAIRLQYNTGSGWTTERQWNWQVPPLTAGWVSEETQSQTVFVNYGLNTEVRLVALKHSGGTMLNVSIIPTIAFVQLR